MLCCRLLILQSQLLEKEIQEYHQSVKHFKSRSTQTAGPDLCPICLQRLSADDKSRRFFSSPIRKPALFISARITNAGVSLGNLPSLTRVFARH